MSKNLSLHLTVIDNVTIGLEYALIAIMVYQIFLAGHGKLFNQLQLKYKS
jgi:hypothetical protein